MDPKVHIEERILEYLILEPQRVQGERSAIEDHLRGCAGCAALYEEIRDYYAEVSQLQSERANQAGRALARRDRIIPFHSFMDQPAVPYPRPSAAIRVFRFIRRHPVSFSMSLAAALVLGVLAIIPRPKEKDLNPDDASAIYEDLLVFNKDRDTLWKRHIGYIHEMDDMDDYYDKRNFVKAADFDGDKRNEVVHVLGWRKDLPLANTLDCYNFDGSDRWTFIPHASLVWGATRFSDEYRFRAIRVDDFEDQGRPSIVALAEHMREFPMALYRIEGSDGSVRSTYWHPGPMPYFRAYDIDGDGKLEIVFSGKNLAFNKVVAGVLDPASMDGHAPATADYSPAGIPPAAEMYYMAFPQSDLSTLGMDYSWEPERVENFGNGVTRIHVMEKLHSREYYLLFYYFNSKMECDSVRPTLPFEVFHKNMEAQGKLTRKLDAAYFEELRRSVLYWNGKEFVHSAVMTGNYILSRKTALLP